MLQGRTDPEYMMEWMRGMYGMVESMSKGWDGWIMNIGWDECGMIE